MSAATEIQVLTKERPTFHMTECTETYFAMLIVDVIDLIRFKIYLIVLIWFIYSNSLGKNV